MIYLLTSMDSMLGRGLICFSVLLLILANHALGLGMDMGLPAGKVWIRDAINNHEIKQVGYSPYIPKISLSGMIEEVLVLDDSEDMEKGFAPSNVVYVLLGKQRGEMDKNFEFGSWFDGLGNCEGPNFSVLGKTIGLMQGRCSFGEDIEGIGRTLIGNGDRYCRENFHWLKFRGFLNNISFESGYFFGKCRLDLLPHCGGLISHLRQLTAHQVPLLIHSAKLSLHMPSLYTHSLSSAPHLPRLISNSKASKDSYNDQPPLGPFEGCTPAWRAVVGCFCLVGGFGIVLFSPDRWGRTLPACCGGLLVLAGTATWLTGEQRCDGTQGEHGSIDSHSIEIVPRKYLTSNSYWGTVIHMANVLNTDKQIAVIAALAEGSSLRSIERITGIHHDTIGRLAVKVGQGCAALLDSSMRNLPCNRLEMDEIWGFVGKKDRNVREGEDGVGSVWTFCVIDAETKLVPAFKCGNRDAATAKAFVQDVANRMAFRVQISTDGLAAYVPAMQAAFGEFVDYGQIVKTYGHEEVSDNRRYSAPKFVSAEKKTIIGIPDERLISTSYVERLNATTRLHMRRLTRLTLAFSKKRENFEAAVALHFAYYNFVKRHNTLRCTPAMAAGVTGTFWSVGDLVEAAA